MAKATPSNKSAPEIAVVPMVLATIGVIGLLGVAWLTDSCTAIAEMKPVKAKSVGPLSGGQKLCSAYIRTCSETV
jgi:hypothetical protein